MRERLLLHLKRTFYLGFALIMFLTALKSTLLSYGISEILSSLMFGWFMSMFILTFKKEVGFRTVFTTKGKEVEKK